MVEGGSVSRSRRTGPGMQEIQLLPLVFLGKGGNFTNSFLVFIELIMPNSNFATNRDSY
jgi:hypothetical protein